MNLNIVKYGLCLLLISGISTLQAQTPVYEMDVINGTTVTTCGGLFTDSNPGSGHYADNENYQVTFCSSNGIDLLNFNFGSGSNLTNERIHPSDTLYIYDGVGTSGILLAAVTGTAASTNRLEVLGGSSGDFLSLSSCITFVFVSDGANNEDGWAAGISCVPPTICGSNPAPSDLFGGAPFICNLDGYCGTTSASFGEDYPGNLLGNTGGTCPGPLFGGTLENNSWLQFEAAATNVSFDISVTNCAGSGIQIAIFDYNPATGVFTRMSPCALSDGSNNGNFSLTGTGLTVGQNYFIMVDGNAGSVCDYSISANSGIAVADAGPDQAICSGASANLSATGPAGSTYSWSAIGGGFGPISGANQSVTPASTTSYVVTATGTCSAAMDTVVVTVNACAACSITGLAAGAQSACVPASNTYTQDVTVTYSNPPGSGTLNVNGQTFSISGSPQTVTLTGLTANGNPVNVTAIFSADPACTMTTNGLFTAPASCSGAPCTPDNGTWD